MLKRLMIFLWLVPVLLVACSGTQTDTKVEDSASSVAASPEVEPTEIGTIATTAPQTVASGPQMECTLVSSQPETPAELADIFSVKEADWVQGPDTAAVTFVEYSDFQ